jgi:hypothetical protein
MVKTGSNSLKTLVLSAFFICGMSVLSLIARTSKDDNLKFFGAGNTNFQYTGRVDFSNPDLPKFWAPGVYIQARFSGHACEIQLNDEMLWGKNHNYITVVIDHGQPTRIKLKDKENKIMVAENLEGDSHNLLICKSTEAGIGFLEFVGIRVKSLLIPDALPERKIEFIGNSITCGTGCDTSAFPCGQGEWYDQHNAYQSYGPTTARLVNARWVLTSVSGIGLVHSCCNLDRVMPGVIDKINLNNNSIAWNFSKYQPDVVCIMLGQNDGIQDSTVFCQAYIKFIERLRGFYPGASIICLTSPMADEKLVTFMKNCISSIIISERYKGDNNVYSYFFTKRFHGGCGDHPSLTEHAEIAGELAAFISKAKNWK